MMRRALFLLVLIVVGVVPTAAAQVDVRQRILAKAERAQKLVEQVVELGEIPIAAIAKLERVPELEAQGKIQEVEGLLDELLEELEPRALDLATVPTYTAFRAPRRVTIRGYDDHSMEPFMTRDGRFLMFNNLNKAPAITNLHYAERVDDVTFQYRGEIGGVNTRALEGVPTMDRNGNFYFVSVRSYGQDFSTIYQGRWREELGVSDVRLVPGLSRREPGLVNFDVDVSPDGNTLYFVDGLFGATPPPKTADLVVARRDESGEFRRAEDSGRIMASVNTDALEYAASISNDGLELFFTRSKLWPGRLSIAVWRTARETVNEPFGEPQRVAAIQGFVEATTFSPDEKALYYHRRDGERFVIYLVER